MRSILLLLVAALLACGANALGPAPVDPPAKTSLKLVAEARERGEIDDDTATLYRVFAVKDGTRLPPQYRGSAPIRDGTTVLREAKARFPTLRPEIKEILEPYLFPKGSP